MRSDATTTRAILIGVVLTLAAIAGRELLPRRTVELTGTNQRWLSAAADPALADRVQWIDEKHLRFRCHYRATDTVAYQPCSLSFVLNAPGDGTRGVDLSRFQSVHLDLTYKGPAPFLRLAARNFDPRFSTEKDANSARIQSTNLRARDIAAPVTIELSDLTVPDWWIAAFNLPRAYNVARLDNVVSLTIDVPDQLKDTEQEFEVRHVTLQGEWVGRDTLYLAILSIWIVAALVYVGRRLVHLRSAHDQLNRLVRIDPLTGALNRRGGEEALATLVEQQRPFVLLVVDLDHFKRVNDTHGHAVGDDVLRHTATVISNSVRTGDLIARWGGEEFLVACLDCPVEQGARIAQKMCDRLAESWIGRHGTIAVTASIGVAAAVPGVSYGEAFDRADAAMYRAKASGRNRVVLDDSSRTGGTPVAQAERV
jgi:diguanylate cyclase (GGDEF)-like protein